MKKEFARYILGAIVGSLLMLIFVDVHYSKEINHLNKITANLVFFTYQRACAENFDTINEECRNRAKDSAKDFIDIAEGIDRVLVKKLPKK